MLDNSLRILQAIVDIAADAGWGDTATAAMALVQALMQGRWHDDPPGMQLPGVGTPAAAVKLGPLPALLADPRAAVRAVEAALGRSEAKAVLSALERFPGVELAVQKVERRGEEWAVEVAVSRVAGRCPRGGAPRAFAPRFPKIKEEGWWLVALAPGSNELLALKRVTLGRRATATLAVPAGEGEGPLGTVELRLVCDSYMGLDQTHIVDLK